MQYQNIIFDLDGTLTDSRLGIFNSLKFALQSLNVCKIPETLPKGFIGPPLQKGFQHVFGLNENETKLAVKYFREYYGEIGWKENEPYQGIPELLNELSLSNKKIFVATAKLENYANQIMAHFGLKKYLNGLYGANYNENKAGKTHIIARAVTENTLNLEDTVVVGDTHFDINGAKELGMASIAVGYGFSTHNELKALCPDFFADEVDDLFNLIV